MKESAQQAPPERAFQDGNDAAPGSGSDGARSREGYADFFGRVSHDLRSPLGIVMHVMQRLESDLRAQLTDEQQVLVRLGARGVRRLQGFVERLGLLSELESDDLEVNLQAVDVGQVVRRATDASVAYEPRSDVTVSCVIPETACLAVADPALLSRAVAELLTNAVAHARRTVRAGIINEAARAVVFVEDDGPGVSAEARESLYRRFVARDARGGLGIGLSMVKELMRAQSGEVALEDSTLPPGRPGTIGARFALSVPRAIVATRPGS